MGDERLVVGRVARSHGIRGEVAIDVESDAPDRFAAGRVVGTDDRPLTVETVRAHHGRLLVKFREIPDRTAADALRGAELTIPIEDAHPLPPGSWYPWQLEGCEVVDATGAVLGTWARAEASPANDLWVVDTGEGEVLVPAVADVVRDVDLDGRRIVVDPPPGLFDER